MRDVFWTLAKYRFCDQIMDAVMKTDDQAICVQTRASDFQCSWGIDEVTRATRILRGQYGSIAQKIRIPVLVQGNKGEGKTSLMKRLSDRLIETTKVERIFWINEFGDHIYEVIMDYIKESEKMALIFIDDFDEKYVSFDSIDERNFVFRIQKSSEILTCASANYSSNIEGIFSRQPWVIDISLQEADIVRVIRSMKLERKDEINLPFFSEDLIKFIANIVWDYSRFSSTIPKLKTHLSPERSRTLIGAVELYRELEENFRDQPPNHQSGLFYLTQGHVVEFLNR